MSKLSCVKGKTFERKLATVFREHWPEAVVRRASQADRAHQADVYVTGGPPLLSRLWIEANDARKPQPLVKLEQAERDVTGRSITHPIAARDNRLPVVIWHKLREQTIHVTMRLWTLDALRSNLHVVSEVVTTITLDDFLGVLRDAVSREIAKAA